MEKSGPFFQKKNTKNKGCQIDLLIQTKFGTPYLCELKFYLSEVGKQVFVDVEEKIKRLAYPKGAVIESGHIQVI